jgi:hypothetical protein
MNSKGEAVDQGSFFKQQAYDCTDDEHDFPQGHVDRI